MLTPKKDCLIVGDVHGHLDRLEALLIQEGILGPCPDCRGTGNSFNAVGVPPSDFCTKCDGDGQRRINHDVEVVQLGDLGHFGGATASPTGDILCYKYADDWLDVVLWGNHDRAMVDKRHEFKGFLTNYPAKRYMQALVRSGKLRMAHEAHGFFISHAGMHQGYKQQRLPASVYREDPSSLSEYLNSMADDDSNHAIWDAISSERGGRAQYGGILWRDETEKLYSKFSQVYGHSASWEGKVRKHNFPEDNTVSYNIDIGGKDEARLAGIWLPSKKVVTIGV